MISPGPIRNKHKRKFVKVVSETIPMGRMGNLKILIKTYLSS